MLSLKTRASPTSDANAGAIQAHDLIDWGTMKRMGKANLVALLHALSGAGALVASLYTETDLLPAARFIKLLGFAVFGAGMLLFVVATVYLRRAFLGNIEPVTDRLITSGPYRWVRHPLYLGMFVAALGVAIAFRSL
jgi:protein-S-isoprenylcysteine O-methyltransferase Ste14